MAKKKDFETPDSSKFDTDFDIEDQVSALDTFEFTDDAFENTENNRSPINKVRKGISAGLEASMDSFLPSLRSKLASKMPNLDGFITEGTRFASDLKFLTSDFLKESQQDINTIRRAVAPIANKADRFLPKFVQELLEPPEDTSPAKLDPEKARKLAVSAEVGSIFKQQERIATADTADRKIDSLIDRRIGQHRHKQLAELLDQIRISSRFQMGFTQSLYVPYLKKDLELKIQQMLLTKDIRGTLKAFSKIVEGKLDQIRHNTALPDIQKAHLFESFKEDRRRRINNAVIDKVSEWGTHALSKIKSRIFDRAKSAMGDLASGLSMASDLIGDRSSPGLMSPASAIGSMIGGFIGPVAAGKLADKIGDTSNMFGKKIRSLDDLFKNIKLKTALKFQDITDNAQDTQLGSILSLFSPDIQRNAGTVSNVHAEQNPDAPAQFTNAVSTSITTIMPGYLAMIQRDIRNLAMGTTDAQELIFDRSRSDFVTKSQYRSDVLKKAFGTKEERTGRMGTSMGAFRGALALKGLDFEVAKLDASAKDLSTFIANHAIHKYSLSASALIKYARKLASPEGADVPELSSAESKYIHVVFKDVKDPKTLASLLSIMVSNASGGIDVNTVATLDDQIAIHIREENHLGTLLEEVTSGNRRHLGKLLTGSGRTFDVSNSAVKKITTDVYDDTQILKTHITRSTHESQREIVERAKAFVSRPEPPEVTDSMLRRVFSKISAVSTKLIPNTIVDKLKSVAPVSAKIIERYNAALKATESIQDSLGISEKAKEDAMRGMQEMAGRDVRTVSDIATLENILNQDTVSDIFDDELGPTAAGRISTPRPRHRSSSRNRSAIQTITIPKTLKVNVLNHASIGTSVAEALKAELTAITQLLTAIYHTKQSVTSTHTVSNESPAANNIKPLLEQHVERQYPVPDFLENLVKLSTEMSESLENISKNTGPGLVRRLAGGIGRGVGWVAGRAGRNVERLWRSTRPIRQFGTNQVKKIPSYLWGATKGIGRGVGWVAGRTGRGLLSTGGKIIGKSYATARDLTDWSGEKYRDTKQYLVDNNLTPSGIYNRSKDYTRQKLSALGDVYQNAKANVKALDIGGSIKNTIDRTKTVATAVAGRAIFVDVYRKNEVEIGKPLLSMKQQMKGVVFNDGKPVRTSYRIDKPVIDPSTGNTIVTDEDLKHGLVDVYNRPLNRALGGILTSAAGSARSRSWKSLRTFFSANNPLFGPFGHLMSAAWSGIVGIGKGIGKAWNFLTDTNGSKKYKAIIDTIKNNVGTKLDTLIEILRGGGSLTGTPGPSESKPGDTDGDGKTDSAYERFVKQETAKKEKAKDKRDEATIEILKDIRDNIGTSKDSKKGGILSGLSELLGNVAGIISKPFKLITNAARGLATLVGMISGPVLAAVGLATAGGVAISTGINQWNKFQDSKSLTAEKYQEKHGIEYYDDAPLQTVTRWFGFNKTEFQRIRSKYYGINIDERSSFIGGSYAQKMVNLEKHTYEILMHKRKSFDRELIIKWTDYFEFDTKDPIAVRFWDDWYKNRFIPFLMCVLKAAKLNNTVYERVDTLDDESTKKIISAFKKEADPLLSKIQLPELSSDGLTIYKNMLSTGRYAGPTANSPLPNMPKEENETDDTNSPNHPKDQATATPGGEFVKGLTSLAGGIKLAPSQDQHPVPAFQIPTTMTSGAVGAVAGGIPQSTAPGAGQSTININDIQIPKAANIGNGDADLGDYVAQFESGTKGSTVVAYDGTGGTSYGKYQMASIPGSTAEFVNWMGSNGGEFGKKFHDAMWESIGGKSKRVKGVFNTGSRSGPPVEVWKKFASAEPNFKNYEYTYVKQSHYDLAMKKFSGDLRQLIDSDRGLQEMIWSISVQHGPAGCAGLVKGAYKPGMTAEQLITAVYAERGNHFKKSTPGIQAAVRDRFKREIGVILGLSRSKKSPTDTTDTATATASSETSVSSTDTAAASATPTPGNGGSAPIETTATPQVQPTDASAPGSGGSTNPISVAATSAINADSAPSAQQSNTSPSPVVATPISTSVAVPTQSPSQSTTLTGDAATKLLERMSSALSEMLELQKSLPRIAELLQTFISSSSSTARARTLPQASPISPPINTGSYTGLM